NCYMALNTLHEAAILPSIWREEEKSQVEAKQQNFDT
ncbi:hypothetical protein A2U01_0048784, partial [Trifolium medium]|nr:hypothetical protein [Trifolium medium]